ncbi:MAG TPA: DUF4292 domain-containing protein [Salinimicrobium sp.]|nr:DUF4292 domain-containing protein [Salinimicrobium sp.]
MNKLRFIILLFVGSVLLSCGSSRNKVLPAEDAAVNNVISRHYQNQTEFETLQGRLRVHYQDESTDQTVTVSFRMKKDDTIWMSGKVLGFPLAKVLITPESVQYYEKISKTYFDGDFRLLSDLLGTPLDFEKVQNLLLGQAIYDLKKERYELTESSRGYQLEPVQENFITRMFLVNPANYKMMAQQVSRPEKNQGVIVTYPSYQEVDGRIIPEEIKIVANDGASGTLLEMEFSSLDFNVPLSFPFSIPSGYQEITVE